MGIVFAYFLPKIQRTSHPVQKKVVISISAVIVTFYLILTFLSAFGQNYTISSLHLAIAPIGVSLVMSLLIFIFHPQSRLIKYKLSPKTFPSLVHLSRLSYPLYLIHFPILVAVLNTTTFPAIPDVLSFLSIFSSTMLIVYLASIYLYLLIERPIQSVRKILNLG